MAIIQSGATADLLTVDPTSKAARVTLYNTDGSLVNHEFLTEYYLSVNIPRFTSALAANSAIFSIRNGATRRLKLVKMVLVAGFDGTAAATTAQYSVRRFTTATPTGGTTLTTLVVPEDSAMAASTIADARCATAGAALTITSVVVGNPIVGIAVPRGATGSVAVVDWTQDIVLNANEGILVQYDVAGVIGDSLTVTMYWGEYV